MVCVAAHLAHLAWSLTHTWHTPTLPHPATPIPTLSPALTPHLGHTWVCLTRGAALPPSPTHHLLPPPPWAVKGTPTPPPAPGSARAQFGQFWVIWGGGEGQGPCPGGAGACEAGAALVHTWACRADTPVRLPHTHLALLHALQAPGAHLSLCTPDTHLAHALSWCTPGPGVRQMCHSLGTHLVHTWRTPGTHLMHTWHTPGTRPSHGAHLAHTCPAHTWHGPGPGQPWAGAG